VIEIAILVGLALNLILGWKTLRDMDQLEEVVLQMLIDLGEKGVLKVEVHEDD
jgi:hypothetical protein